LAQRDVLQIAANYVVIIWKKLQMLKLAVKQVESYMRKIQVKLWLISWPDEQWGGVAGICCNEEGQGRSRCNPLRRWLC